MKDADVLIVGAGPAGATAAILLARCGLDVTIVDKARFPRDKLCGEFLSPEALRVLDRAGALPAIAGEGASVREVLLSDASGRAVRLTLPVPSGAGRDALGIPRRRLDAALVSMAAREGATVLEEIEAREPVLDADGRVRGVLAVDRGSGTRAALRARFVLAADGRSSVLGRALAPKAWRRASPLFGLKAHFRGAERVAGAAELHYFHGGYVGLQPVGEGIVNLCALIDRSLACRIPSDPERIFREVLLQNRAARARLANAERVSEWLAVGSLVFRPRTPVRSGVLLLGDAAGTIDPFAGEGISMALRSAELAAGAVAREAGAIPGEAPAPPGSAAAGYGLGWRREFVSRIRICRIIGRIAARGAVQRPAVLLLQKFPRVGSLLGRGTRAGAALTASGAGSL